MKKPVLAATDDNTDIGEIIEKAGCGCWVEAGDTKSIQERISQLCNDDLITMGNRGWKLLQDEYLVDRSYNLIVKKVNV